MQLAKRDWRAEACFQVAKKGACLIVRNVTGFPDVEAMATQLFAFNKVRYTVHWYRS
jgi:hypothetical protein